MITATAAFTRLIAAADPTQDWIDCENAKNVWTGWMNPGACTPSVADLATDAIGEHVVKPYVDDIKNGVSAAVKTMVSFWIDVPDPAIGGVGDQPVADSVSFLQNGLNPLVAIIMCFVILFGITMIAWTYRTEPARQIGNMILQYILIQGTLAVGVSVALELVNVTSKWLIEQSTQGTSFADNLFALFDTTEGVGSMIILIILLIIAALIAALTCILMIARGAVLFCLVGAAGLAVALGQQVLRQYLAWILAFVLYKLAAAIIYAVGFRLLGTNTSIEGNGFLQILYGLTLLGMVVLALPAVIRLVVPAVAPAAQGRGAGAAVAAAGGAAATALVRR